MARSKQPKRKRVEHLTTEQFLDRIFPNATPNRKRRFKAKRLSQQDRVFLARLKPKKATDYVEHMEGFRDD